MTKAIEFIVVLLLLICAFFSGVKYSESVKANASWLFETKDEEEVELPDLSNESGVELIAPEAAKNNQDINHSGHEGESFDDMSPSSSDMDANTSNENQESGNAKIELNTKSK